MKKIMQINITCGVGSTGRISKTLYEASILRGYEASFAYSTGMPMIEGAFRIENKCQNILRRGLNRVIGRKPIHSAPGTRRLIRYIERENPTLIHLHNVQQNSVDFRLLFDYLKTKDIPVVYTLHDCWAFTGGCYHFTKRGCSEYRDGCIKCLDTSRFDDITVPPLETYRLKKQLIGSNDNIYPLCVSKWLAKVATESYMGDMKNKPRVVYNGIDTDLFCPTPSDLRNRLDISEDTFVVLGVAGYWTEDKGLSMFDKILDRLGDIKIVLIGSGLDSVRSRGDDRYICIDRTENTRQLAEYYTMADVFVNTSIEETFGLTTAEAMSCGTPAIVFDSTACPEVVDESSGIVVDHDIDSMVEAISTIRQNGKKNYSDNARDRIVSEFSIQKMIDGYFEIYRGILDA